jgi:hypothetical protein
MSAEVTLAQLSNVVFKPAPLKFHSVTGEGTGRKEKPETSRGKVDAQKRFRRE